MKGINNLNINTIDPKEIITNDKTKAIIEYVKCSECNFIFNSPIECSVCHNTYCSDCIRHDMQIPNNEEVLKCPSLCLNSTFTKSIFANKLLLLLEFKCLRGCEMILCYKDYLTHINSCFGKLKKCPTCDSMVEMNRLENNLDNIEDNKLLKVKEKEFHNKIEQLTASNHQQIFELENLKEQNKDLKTNYELHETDYKLIIEQLKNKEQEMNEENDKINKELKKLLEENTTLNSNNKNQEKKQHHILMENVVSKINYFRISMRKLTKYTLKCENSRTKENIIFITEVLKYNSTIKEFVIHDYTIIGLKGARFINEALIINKSITTLDLNWNSIGVEGAHFVSEVIKVNKSITTLMLNGNSVGDKGSESISGALIINKGITTLELSNNLIRVKGVESISEALRINQNITTLDLKWNSIGEKGAESLCEALKLNNNITSLDLSYSSIGDKGVKSISDALKINKSITTFKLIGNSIGVKGAEFINEALKVNTSITTLNLSSNLIGDKETQPISDALEMNKSRIQNI